MAGSASRARRRPQRSRRGHRPVGVGDDRAGQRGDDAPLALGQTAPGVDRQPIRIGMPISVIARPTPTEIAGHQEDELGDAEQPARPAGSRSARRCAGRAAPVCSRGDHRLKSRPPGARGRYGKPYRRGSMLRWRQRRLLVVVAAAGALVLAVAPAGAEPARRARDARRSASASTSPAAPTSRARSPTCACARRAGGASSARARPDRTPALQPRAGLYRVVELPAPLRRQLLDARPAASTAARERVRVYAGEASRRAGRHSARAGLHDAGAPSRAAFPSAGASGRRGATCAGAPSPRSR